MKNLRYRKAAMIGIWLLILSAIYYVIYNSYFGWNLVSESKNELINDIIYKVFNQFGLVLMFLPLVGYYIDQIWDSNKTFYWYRVKYTYVNSKGEDVFTYENESPFEKQDDILDKRKRNLTVPALHKIKNAKRFLDNGTMKSEVISYLGYFKTNRYKK